MTTCFQTPRTAVSWLPLGVQRVYGLDSAMTQNVCICSVWPVKQNPYNALAMRRVLHLKMVTQCAMLEEFGIFLVLADKVCQHDGVRVLCLTWLFFC